MPPPPRTPLDVQFPIDFDHALGLLLIQKYGKMYLGMS